MRKLISVLTAASLMVFSIIPLSTGAKTNKELLNYEDNGELLGVASAFSVFVEEDFGANGCDCEGRIFAGHSANVGEATSYAVAEDSGASVIISDGILFNFDKGNRIFVYGSNGETQLTGDNVYQADLIAAHEEFEKLREKSRKLSQKNNGEVKINPYWNAQIDFVGTDPDFNIFNLDSNMIDSCNYFFNYEVPEGSYVIINIAGQDLTTYTQLYGMQYAGHRATNNKDEVSKYILFNFYEAENLAIAGTGTLYGTVFAPFANAGDDMTEGAHNAGGVIAKSYIGGIEFGNCTYDGGEPDEVQIPTETTEATTTTSITTTSTATTSTELSTTTTKGTTTTERETETSSTTSTRRATTTLPTTTTSTTNLTTNTTTSTSTTTSTTSTTTSTTTGTTTSITSITGSTERPTSSSTTITTTKQTTTSTTSTTPRPIETTTTDRETTTSATTTTETTTTTTGEVKGTTEVSTNPTTMDWATDIQTTSEATTIETQTSESETTTNTTVESTGTSTTVCSSGSRATEESTTSTSETTIGNVESAKTGDSVDAGKVAGVCGLAMIVGLLAIFGKKEE
jgi:choice-of-anchor A domain-containing protein